MLLQSCRTDYFSENERFTAESNSSLLKNKRISLKDSKHRENLSVELLKANANIIKKSKNLRNGEKSFLENKFSINTDNVIFIENGPNYHTYTFYIDTEKSSDDQPLTNLVLSPLPDGTYKQLLVQYYFTDEQKKKVLRGEPVKANNTVITDLGSVSFSNKTSNLQSCGWEDQAVYVGCSHVESNGESTHNASNVLSWRECTAAVPPSMYTVAVYICTSIEDETNTGGSTPPPMPTPNNGGGGGGNEPCTSCPPGQNPTPQPCTQIPNQPIEPTAGTGEGECSVSIPTLPNLPNPNNNGQCENLKQHLDQAKEMMDNDTVKAKNNEMTATILTDTYEKGMYWGRNSSGKMMASSVINMSVNYGGIPISNSLFTPISTAHNHNGPDLYTNFSPADINGFNSTHQNFPTINHTFANGSDGSMYVMTIEDQLAFNDYVALIPLSDIDAPSATNPLGTGDWKADKQISKDWKFVYRYFRKMGKSEDEANDLAMAYLNNKYNMGIMISKKGSDGKFHPINVEAFFNPLLGFPPVYIQTNPCNL